MDQQVWDRFDMVAVLAYTGYRDRREGLSAELKRIGLVDRAEWFWDFDNPFMTRLANSLRVDGSIPTVGMFRCVMNHYRALKTAVDLGRAHVLVLEDDARFLLDEEALMNAVLSIPQDYDVAKFEWFPRGPLGSAEPPAPENLPQSPVGWVPSVDFSTRGGAAVAYSLAGARWKTELMERCADYMDLHSRLYGNDEYDTPRNMTGLVGYVARPCVAIQRRVDKVHTLNPRTGFLYRLPWQCMGGTVESYGRP